MESSFDNIDNAESDKEFYEAMERRRQRRTQKKQQEKRKRYFIIMILSVVLLIIVIAICIIIAVKKGTVDGEQNENISEEVGIDDSVTEPYVGNVTAESGLEEPVTESGTDEISTETMAQEDTQIYTFESTANTANIYSEEGCSTHAILVNVDADTIVAASGAYDRIFPASMTKVLTVLVAAEAIEKENLDDTFTMTLEITDYAYVNDCSSVGFLDGEVVTVKDLFYGTILPSGGDAAVGLATYVAGSHEAFVEMMNAKLEELGLSDSAHFTNCVGLFDENHYCTVYDMAVIMDAAMQNELCREILSAHTYTTTATTQHPEGIEISNWFLRRIEDKDTGGVVIGGKTGYVDQSGSCAVSYEEYADGTPYICVTVGARSSWRCIYDHVDIYNNYIKINE